MTTIDNVTKAQIEQLLDDAKMAGDLYMVQYCDLALATFGRTPARFDRERAENALARCVQAIQAAEAMTVDEDGCEGHPAGPYDPMGVTVYCDGSCRKVSARRVVR